MKLATTTGDFLPWVKTTAEAARLGMDFVQAHSPNYNPLDPDADHAAGMLATLPFYWKDLEPERGKPRYAKDSPRVYRRPSPDLCVEWCDSNGIEPKEHCLNYPADYTCPDWAKGEVQKEKAFLEKRFRELAERYAGRIPMWEVTNELLVSFRRGIIETSPSKEK